MFLYGLELDQLERQQIISVAQNETARSYSQHTEYIS